jgi:hypothetical protein
MKAMSLRIRMQTLSPCLTPSFAAAAGDAVGAIGDLGMAAPALAADDAEERGRVRSFLFLFAVIRGVSRVPAIHASIGNEAWISDSIRDARKRGSSG